MHIAMVGSRGIPAGVGGVERHVEELSAKLVAKGHKVTVFTRPNYSEHLESYKGINISRIPYIKEKHLEMISHTFLSLCNSLVNNFDILHFHSVDPALLAPLIKWRHKIVSTSHGQAYRRNKWGKVAKWVSMKSEPIFLKYSHACISVSKTLKEYYYNTYQKSSFYIPNGVNIHSNFNSDILDKWGLKKDGYILWSGRMEPTKGCHIAIEAYLKSKTDIPLVIMGGSTYTDSYVKQLHRYKSDKIKFIGYQTGNNMWTILQNTKLFLFPSSIEGLSIALLEAMSQKLPIIYSDIPENSEVCKDVGVSFKTDNILDLANKIIKVINNPELATSLGISAYNRVKKEYNWDMVTEKTEEVYNQVIRK